MVEFALVLPLLLVIMFAVVQFGIIYNDYVTLTDATRAGARKAAVSRLAANPEATTIAAVEKSASGLKPADLDITVTSTFQQGQDVTVRATYPYEVNLLGIHVASGFLSSETTERVE